jgi:hypothetical protein
MGSEEGQARIQRWFYDEHWALLTGSGACTVGDRHYILCGSVSSKRTNLVYEISVAHMYVESIFEKEN